MLINSLVGKQGIETTSLIEVIEFATLSCYYILLQVVQWAAFYCWKGDAILPMTGRCREPNCHAVVIRPLHYCTKHADKEAAYQASRERWTNRTDNSKRYKDYNKRKREYSDIKVEQNKFYQSKQWKSIRDVVRRRDNFLCQYCKAHNRVRTGKIVDHIVPVEFDLNGKTIMDNLAFCCSKCHTRKTKWEQIYYGTGYGNKTKNVIPIKNVKDVPDFQKNER